MTKVDEGVLAASRRRTEVVGIIPNRAAIAELAGAVRVQETDEWAIGAARHMALETIADMGDDHSSASPSRVQPCPAMPANRG